uniref:Uncharacterized protein n=1 Tax=Romanomermis culicivorax TaxID=13658 RepID=A0A915L387_ROMCU
MNAITLHDKLSQETFSAVENLMDAVTSHKKYPECKQMHFRDFWRKGILTLGNSMDAVTLDKKLS